MYPNEHGTSRRPLVLGLIVLAHLTLGLLFFSASDPDAGLSRAFAGAGGSADGARLSDRAPDSPAKTRRAAFLLSFDRTPLVGPSTFAPPSRAARGTPKVAPSSHPS